MEESTIFDNKYFVGQLFNDYINLGVEGFVQRYSRIAVKTKSELSPEGMPALQLIFKKNIFGATEFLTVFRIGFDICLSYTNAKRTFEFVDFQSSIEGSHQFEEVTSYSKDINLEDKYLYTGEKISPSTSLEIIFTRPGGYAYGAAMVLKDWMIS